AWTAAGAAGVSARWGTAAGGGGLGCSPRPGGGGGVGGGGASPRAAFLASPPRPLASLATSPRKRGEVGLADRAVTRRMHARALRTLALLLVLLPSPAAAQPMQERLAPCLALPGENRPAHAPYVASRRRPPAAYPFGALIR